MGCRVVRGTTKDLPAIERLYRDVCGFRESEGCSARWVYGTYPSESDIARHVADGELYLLLEDGALAGSLVVSAESDACGCYGLHLFAVHPDHRGRGLAKEGLCMISDLVKGLGGTTIRLDVIEGNLRAERLYLNAGFRYRSEREESIGSGRHLTFRVFEKIL